MNESQYFNYYVHLHITIFTLFWSHESSVFFPELTERPFQMKFVQTHLNQVSTIFTHGIIFSNGAISTCRFIFTKVIGALEDPRVVLEVVCQQWHNGNELAAITELPGMGLLAAMIRSIQRHLHPHPQDQFQSVTLILPLQLYAQKLVGEQDCIHISIVADGVPMWIWCPYWSLRQRRTIT